MVDLVMMPPREVEVPGPRFRLIPVGELLANREPPSWQIDGLLEAGILAELYGAPESAKSLLAQHLAACTATGLDFFGRAVKRGLAVYLCGEGHRGLQRRFRAWEMHHEASLTSTPLVLSSCGVSLFDELGALTARAAIEEAQSEHGEPLRLVVVDTLARHLAPGNENSQQDMGAFLHNVAQLVEGDATVLLIHHTGHAETTRSRGASSLIGAVDAEYRAEKTGDVISLTAGKLKDGERPDPLAFRLVPADTDLCYEDGSPLNSVVLEPCEAPAAVKVQRPLTAHQRNSLEALKEAIHKHGIWPPSEVFKEGDVPAGRKVVADADWRTVAYARGITEGDGEARKKQFKRTRDALASRGLVAGWEEFWWLI